jgi:putative transposase
MTIPFRGPTGTGAYCVTASSFSKRSLLQSARMAELFINVLSHHQKQGRYLLHEFVVMPDHFHLRITPLVTLEKTVQYIKEGFLTGPGKN